MPFGITGKYVGKDGKSAEFEAAYSDRKAKITSFPDMSIQLIRVYAHGAPGMIGDDDVDSLTGMLGKKMAPDGQIHLLGCSTAGIEGHAYNPIGGLGLLARTLMYNVLPTVMGDDDVAAKWAENLAKDLSRRIPNVYVLGLAGISFPLSRVAGSFEGYKPSALMADRFVYYNSKLSDLP